MLKFSRKTCLILGLVALFFCTMASGAWAKTYSEVLIFGDSLSDKGNMKKEMDSLVTQYAANPLLQSTFEKLEWNKIPESWTDTNPGSVWLYSFSGKLGIADEFVSNKAFGGAMSSGHLYTRFAQGAPFTIAKGIADGAIAIGSGYKNHPLIPVQAVKDAAAALELSGQTLLQSVGKQEITIDSSDVENKATALATELNKIGQQSNDLNNLIGSAKLFPSAKNDLWGSISQTLTQFGLKEQVQKYIDSLGTKEISSDTLVALWIGGNDVMARLSDISAKKEGEWKDAGVQKAIAAGLAPGTDAFTQKVTYEVTESIKKYLKDNIISNITGSIEKLISKGAKNFLLLNLPNLGATPQIVKTGELAALQAKSAGKTDAEQEAAKKAVIDGASQITALFNDLYLVEAHKLFGNCENQAEFVFYNTFGYLDKMIKAKTFPQNSPESYYVLQYDEASKLFNRTTKTNEPVGDYLFWDAIHPTSKAHELLAADVKRFMAEGNPATPKKVDSEIAGGPCFIDTAASQELPYPTFLILLAGLGSLMFLTRITRRN